MDGFRHIRAADEDDACSLPITPQSYNPRRSVGYLMSRNSKLAMVLAGEAFEGAPIGFMEFISLMMLGKGVASTPGDLAEWLGFNSGAGSRLADRLERAGLVRRLRSTSDRRSVGLELTPEGAEKVLSGVPRMTELWNVILKDFAPDEYRALVFLLEKLFGSLQTQLARQRRTDGDRDRSGTSQGHDAA